MDIIMPIGISGSGKSTLYKMYYKNLPVVCPDEIRKEITGNISDQSMNNEVFGEVFKRVENLIRQGKSFFYDATNLNKRLRRRFIADYKRPGVKIIYVVLPANIEVSYERIKNDLNSGKDRSNVPYDELKRQYNMYMESIKSDLKGEGADEIILMKDETMMDYKDIDMSKFTEIIN